MKLILFILISALLSTSPYAQDKLTDRLERLASDYEKNNYHGVILIAKGDRVVFERAYGYANWEAKIRHTPQTRFKTESFGKMFTAVAIQQLVDACKLSLTSTVKDILPRLALKNAEKITIHQLLSHTSGLTDPWSHPKFEFGKNYARTDMERFILEAPRAFEQPGTAFG